MPEFTRKSLFKKILKMGISGELYDISRKDYEGFFYGSIDRYSIIADRLQGRKRILDIGSGNGLLLSILHELGHECYAVDWSDVYKNEKNGVFQKKTIVFKKCFVEVETLPFEDNFFDAVTCCQVFEHFTHSHLHAIREIHRTLKPGGLVEIDVPNAVDLRNRLRVLRGKQITWDYEKDYLYKEPIIYNNRSFFDRHNREFTKQELKTLLKAGGFKEIDVKHLKSSRYRSGFEKIKSMGSAIRDFIPSFRKSIIGFGIK